MMTTNTNAILYTIIVSTISACVDEPASDDARDEAQTLTTSEQSVLGNATDGDGRGFAHVGGLFVAACDTNADNHGVYAEYLWATASNNGSGTVSDHNGHSAGCGEANAPGDIYEFRFCVRKENTQATRYCRPWVWTGN
jgi:hypothetical protein